jgi:Tol biopolymer transport system component
MQLARSYARRARSTPCPQNVALLCAFLLAILWPLPVAAQAHLLVESYGRLSLVAPDGRQTLLADHVNVAALSPDGRYVAFTKTDQALLVVAVESGQATQIVQLPQGAHFGEIGWTPDGAVVAYEAIVQGRSDDLFLAPFPSQRGPARNLGHWYQGFSFSPDGSKIVHAVNGDSASGLEILDLATGQRSFVHRAQDIVWDARFSPDGRYVAYRMTVSEPDRSDDDPDCTPPTLGLRLYSMDRQTDVPVIIRGAPENWEDVKTYEWSPDSKQIALTLGPVACDYPGDAADVFVTSVDLKFQMRLSTSGMSFEPAFSPDGLSVAFVDFSNSPARLFRYDLAGRASTLIRRATEQNNYYHLYGWR